MALKEQIDLDEVRISSWSAPSEDDLAILEQLSDEQFRILLHREIERGMDSGVSSMSMEDIWNEAKRRSSVKNTAPNAV